MINNSDSSNEPMKNNNNNLNHSILMKSERLRNMMNNLTEQAQKQLNESAKSSREEIIAGIFPNSLEIEEDSTSLLPLNIHGTSTLLNKPREANKIIEHFGVRNSKYEIIEEVNNPENNENFTQEYYMERYKKYIPSNLVTPTDFNKNIGEFFHENAGNNFNNNLMSNISSNNRRSVPNFSSKNRFDKPSQNYRPINSFSLVDLVASKFNSDFLQSQIESLSLFNWIKIFNELNENQKISLENFLDNLGNPSISSAPTVYFKIESFFSRFTFKTKNEIVICEVKKINVLDCLQIIEVTDFYSVVKKVLVTSEEYTKDSKGKLCTENPIPSFTGPLILRDDQFKEGEVILLKHSGLKEMSINGGKPMFVISLKNIKQQH
jgi:hypothetical protein